MAHQNQGIIDELDKIAASLDSKGAGDVADIVDQVAQELLAEKPAPKVTRAAAKPSTKVSNKRKKTAERIQRSKRTATVTRRQAQRVMAACEAELIDIATELFEDGDTRTANQLLKYADDVAEEAKKHSEDEDEDEDKDKDSDEEDPELVVKTPDSSDIDHVFHEFSSDDEVSDHDSDGELVDDEAADIEGGDNQDAEEEDPELEAVEGDETETDESDEGDAPADDESHDDESHDDELEALLRKYDDSEDEDKDLTDEEDEDETEESKHEDPKEASAEAEKLVTLAEKLKARGEKKLALRVAKLLK